ncbi:AGAP007095-PA-like protein [Anopheles sinensis]|uniref:AGAP007095-PA-like protein n=1 Tax=Anopheles sinensis TaxID=74873 RepID=A0A084VZ36_ANOSI|nr:AGAP007095-PA-like protein [Anopheles sinensis]
MNRGIRSSRLISYDDTARSPPMPIPLRNRHSDVSGQRSSYEGGKKEIITKNIEQLLICGLCELRLTAPKMLNCQHTFCLVCLESCLQKQPDKTYLGCFTCGAKQLLKDADLSALPSNLHIDNMLLMMHPTPTLSSGHLSPVTSYQLENSRFSEINDEINGCFREKILALQRQQSELLDAAQGILNDAICSHEVVREKIELLLVSLRRPIVGSLDPVQLYLKLHKDMSIILEEVSLWGQERILFNREKLKVETLFGSPAQTGAQVKRSSSSRQTPIKHQLHPNSSETTVAQFYKNHVYKPRLMWNHCQRPSGVSFAPWNHESLEKPLLYVAGSECRIVFGINKANGQIMHKITHEELSYPQGLAFDAERKEMFVSDTWNHCIFVFSHDGNLLRKLCSKGDQAGQLRSPQGIAFSSDDFIFVCDTGNDRIQCLSTIDGKLHSQFGRLTKDQLIKASQTKTTARMVDLKNPTDIAVQKDSSVLVLDAGNRRVKMFNRFGEQLLEFGQTGTINGQFQYPEVIGVDPAGFILVGDGGNAKILVYRPNGQFVTALGSRGDSAGKFNWISGICISKDWEIVVSDYKNHAVQLIF